MAETLEVLRSYIEDDKIDYAVVLNGKWGSGKTYFVKNELLKEVKGKQWVYVSLFGKHNIEDIWGEIITQVCSQFCNNSLDKYSETKAKKFWKKYFDKDLNVQQKSASPQSFNFIDTSLRIVSSISKLVGFDKDKRKLLSDWLLKGIDYKEFIYVFDDFERSDISIKELLGMVNFLSEQNHAHVICVCDEERISEKDKDVYDEFKEKTIRLTIPFSPDIKRTIARTIENEFEEEKIKKLVKQYSDSIGEIISVSELYNFRILKYALNRFEYLYSKLQEKVVNKYKSENDKNVFWFTVFNAVLMFSLYVFCGCRKVEEKIEEEKRSQKKEKQKDGQAFSEIVNDIDEELNSLHLVQGSIVSKLTDVKQLSWSRSSVVIYPFVAKYVEFLDFDENLVNDYFDNSQERISGIDAVKNEIHDAYQQEESEAINSLEEIAKRIESDECDINGYHNIMSNLFKLCDILEQKEIKDSIKESMRKNVEQHCLGARELGWQAFEFEEDEIKNFTKELIALARTKKLEKLQNMVRATLDIDVHYGDADRTLTDIGILLQTDKNQLSRIKRFLSLIELEKIQELLTKLKNKDMYKLIGYLAAVYTDDAMDKFSEEKEYLSDLSQWLFEKINDTNEDKLKRFYYKELREFLVEKIELIKIDRD